MFAVKLKRLGDRGLLKIDDPDLAVAALAAVSKHTVYKNFPGKESLFVEIVRSVTNEASDSVHNEMPDLAEGEEISSMLVAR